MKVRWLTRGGTTTVTHRTPPADRSVAGPDLCRRRGVP
jgi:hypothetical protein